MSSNVSYFEFLNNIKATRYMKMIPVGGEQSWLRGFKNTISNHIS